MTRQMRSFLAGVLIVCSGLALLLISVRPSGSRRVTFEECASLGGTAWRVDLYHPDICPACAAYTACKAEYDDLREECPECYGPCETCQEQYTLDESCPECYGPCQACQNEYRNDFRSQEERYELCPACKACDLCREELNAKRSKCPPCVSCNRCREANKRYSDIREVCPQIKACGECMEDAFPYPAACPQGREKIGEISDAAIWFQCCR